MIDALLHWRKHALPPGAQLGAGHREFPSMPDLSIMHLTSASSEEDFEKLQQQPRVARRNGKRPEQVKEEPDEETKPCNRLTPASLTDSAFMSSQLAEGEIHYDDLEFGKQIGSGGFKQVYKGAYVDEEVAIGVISVEKLGEEDLRDLENEMHVLSQLRHDSIVRYIGTAKLYEVPSSPPPTPTRKQVRIRDETMDLQKYCIVTEFCMHGDLSDFMQKVPRPTFQKQLSLMYDIAFGCSYLHGRRPAIIHRDLKSLNILIDENERAKISDFGLAKIKKKARTLMHTVVGTPNWQAPEMWTDEPNYTEKVDVYSCGLIFWEILMWSNQYPFSELTDFQIYEQVGKKNVRPPMGGALKKYPQQILTLIEEMWDADPDKRPSMLEVVSVLSELMR
jgi:serine/threonine protein kinase